MSEGQNLKEEISNLNDFTLSVNSPDSEEKLIGVKYKVSVTMLDGKAISVQTETSSHAVCNICGASPKIMNNLSEIRERDIDVSALSYGLSTLHCWIRCFEFCLHLAYRLDLKVYAVRKQQQPALNERKLVIQQKFREKLNLLVDQAKQGFGNSNTGNVARRAFENAETFSEITGISLEVILRLRTVLKAVCCGYYLKITDFKIYCLETSNLIVSLYGWYRLPATVHKLLEHSHQIAEVLELPLGYYSEEPQGAQHKEIRKARLNHTAKISRQNAMENMYHYMLVKSDPKITSIKFKNESQEENSFTAESVLKSLLVINTTE